MLILSNLPEFSGQTVDEVATVLREKEVRAAEEYVTDEEVSDQGRLLQ